MLYYYYYYYYYYWPNYSLSVSVPFLFPVRYTARVKFTLVVKIDDEITSVRHFRSYPTAASAAAAAAAVTTCCR